MTFASVSILSAIGLFLSLTLYRFTTTHPEARKNIIYSVIARKYWAWIVARILASLQKASPAKWLEFVKRTAFWSYPDLEKGLFAVFYGSFSILAGSGFFFAFFIRRGLFGYPLLIHVMAGGFFSLSLMIILILRGKNYLFKPELPEPDLSLWDLKRLRPTAVRIQNVSFWIFALSGLLLTVSAFIPMFPILRYGGLKLMFDLHRYSALAAVLSATAFGTLVSFSASRRTPAESMKTT